MGKADIQSKRNYQLIVGKAATERSGLGAREPTNDRPTLRSTGSLAPAHALSAHFTSCTHWRPGLLGISVAKVVRSINISTQSAAVSLTHTPVSHSLPLGARDSLFFLYLSHPLFRVSSSPSLFRVFCRSSLHQFGRVCCRIAVIFSSSLQFTPFPFFFRRGACRSEGDRKKKTIRQILVVLSPLPSQKTRTGKRKKKQKIRRGIGNIGCEQRDDRLSATQRRIQGQHDDNGLLYRPNTPITRSHL